MSEGREITEAAPPLDTRISVQLHTAAWGRRPVTAVGSCLGAQHAAGWRGEWGEGEWRRRSSSECLPLTKRKGPQPGKPSLGEGVQQGALILVSRQTLSEGFMDPERPKCSKGENPI